MDIKKKSLRTRLLNGRGSPFLGGERSSEDCIKITLIANAGVLVEHNDVGLLVDGIHHEDGHPFSQVSENDIKLMRQGLGIFDNLDYLLFTHEHPDHLTPQYVSEFIRQRSVKGIFLPNEHDGSTSLTLLLNQIQKIGIPYWTLGLETGETKRFVLADDLIVTAIGTRHMGPQFASIKNDCFLLTLAGKNLLFTGDADHVAQYFKNALSKVALDAVFVNPIFYHNSNGQKIINEILHPRHVVIYHMPFEQDDVMQFSYMAKSDIERYRRPGILTHVLSSEKQTLCLS